MFGPWKNAETSQAVGSEFVLGDHAFDGVLNGDGGVFLDDLFELELGEAAWEATVAIVFL